MSNPVREIKTIINDSGIEYRNRIMVGTAMTGLLRAEWVAARYSQLIPMNWSQVQYNHFLSGYIPLRYQVDDAQNIIVREAVEKDFEWLFFLEHDVIIPDNTLVMLNEYMRDAKYPVVSGLYYSRSRPSEPLIFRGRGNSVYTDWKPGDLVWCDGVPTGCLLIHRSILKIMWDESPEYIVRTPDSIQVTRRVFWTPREMQNENGMHNMISGTSDLHWCDRVMKDEVMQRAGWNVSKFAPDEKHPFLVDTNMFCRHINPDGEQFP